MIVNVRFFRFVVFFFFDGEDFGLFFIDILIDLMILSLVDVLFSFFIGVVLYIL